MVYLVWWFLFKTKQGLILRAIGDNHDAAHAIGHNVVRYRVMAILFGGAMAGIGGAFLSLVQVPIWGEGYDCWKRLDCIRTCCFCFMAAF